MPPADQVNDDVDDDRSHYTKIGASLSMSIQSLSRGICDIVGPNIVQSEQCLSIHSSCHCNW